MKKKFKDTKVGKWLIDKAPEILDVVGDFVPDAGLLGAVGKMIDSSQMTPQEKQYAQSQLTTLYQLEVEDRKNARFLIFLRQHSAKNPSRSLYCSLFLIELCYVSILH